MTDATPAGGPTPARRPAVGGTGRGAGHGAVPAWRSWAVGTRVVVRRRLPEGGWTDVLGDLLEVGDGGVVVATRRGPVRVAGTDIALGKPVPPPPARRPAAPAGGG